jgi:hypothetical protein
VPVTPFQATIAALLANNRSEDSYLAGGAALHFSPNSVRFSNDLDYFNNSVERVASAFAQDRAVLTAGGFTISVSLNQPGFVRATVSKNGDRTKVEWVHDSAWRFLPVVSSAQMGQSLHPIDLAINKVLALVGRNEIRDFVDVLEAHSSILPLGAMCWAAAGKDPGYTPFLLLELLRRRGVYQPEDLARLHLAKPLVLTHMKVDWRRALESAEAFVHSRPVEEAGCLYFDSREHTFVEPKAGEPAIPHYGRPGGLLPTF